MKSKAYLSCTLCLLFLVLFLSANVASAQDTRTLEERISALRLNQELLEQQHAEIQDDIRKVESGNYLFLGGFGVLPRERYERMVAVQVLIGEWTFEKALEESRRIFGLTRAFPQGARVILSRIEDELTKTKRELLALEVNRSRQERPDPRDRNPEQEKTPDIIGVWNDHLGRTITFSVSGNQATGRCKCNSESAETTINGTLSGNILEGEYSQPALSIAQYRRGQLRFVFNADGRSWSGEWWDANGAKGGVWNGSRADVKR